MANSNVHLPPTPLESLQLAFCLIKLGGDLLVVDRSEVEAVLCGTKLGSIDFYKPNAGEKLMKRFLEKLPAHCDVKKTIADFWVNPNTHMYTDISFSPKKQPPTTLNYWVGNLIQPAQGDWNVIKTHLLDVVCDGNTAVYFYVVSYLAHMLQLPHIKPGIMLILLGKQGTGKGLFFQILQRIWPRSSLLVSDINQVIGQFNAALERNYVIIMDEAMFSGDRKSQDRMKSLITEKTCHIEQKYQPSRTIESVHRFFASSNHEHFSHVEADDRRSLFVRVSDVHQGDQAYFDKLANAIDDDQVIAAMIHDLMLMDITTFDIRSRPPTIEHANQKLKSLQGLDRYWFEVLMRGNFGLDRFSTDPWEKDGFIPTETLIRSFIDYDKRAQKFSATTSKEVSDVLTRLCPSSTRTRQAVFGKPQRGYKLPSLTIARKEFEQAYNCSVDWDDGGDDTTDQSSSDDAELAEAEAEAEVEVASVATNWQENWQKLVQ
jgi:hypothetical protein